MSSERGRAGIWCQGSCDSVVALTSNMQTCRLRSRVAYLSRASATQRCKKSISAVVAWCAHDSLDHRNHTSALEQVHLPRIFLEDLREGEPFNSTLAFILRRRLYRYMCWMMVLALFNAEEARTSRVGGAQAQKDIEQRTRGSWWRLHYDYVLFLVWRCRQNVSWRWCTRCMWNRSCTRPCRSTWPERRCPGQPSRRP